MRPLRLQLRLVHESSSPCSGHDVQLPGAGAAPCVAGVWLVGVRSSPHSLDTPSRQGGCLVSSRILWSPVPMAQNSKPTKP